MPANPHDHRSSAQRAAHRVRPDQDDENLLRNRETNRLAENVAPSSPCTCPLPNTTTNTTSTRALRHPGTEWARVRKHNKPRGVSFVQLHLAKANELVDQCAQDDGRSFLANTHQCARLASSQVSAFAPLEFVLAPGGPAAAGPRPGSH